MKAKDTADGGNDMPRLDRRHWSYLEVAGTNIEDIDRAIEAGAWFTSSTEVKDRSGIS